MPRSKYSTTRSNIVKQVKNLLNKGYYTQSSSIDYFPPKQSELGHEPTQEDVYKLHQFIEQLKSQLKIDITDKASGDKKTLSYYEGEKYFREQASKKAQLTKLMKDMPDNPPEYEYDEEWEKVLNDDYIVYTKEEIQTIDDVKRRIGDLVGFKSIAKNHSTARHNESIVNDIGDTLLAIFEHSKATDYDGLLNRLRDNAMVVNSDLDRVKTAYLEEDNGLALTERLIEIFLGRHLTVDEAKHFDNGYDEPIQVDENGEVIE